jgi:putative acetyltransferase
MKIDIRHVEPEDFKAIQELHTQPNVIFGTMQLPFPSAEPWRKRLAEKSDSLYGLVACIEEEICGFLCLWIETHSARRRHVGGLGMAVHDRWQGKGVGAALMNAAIELADRWLNIKRLELHVYSDNEAAVKIYQKFGFKIEGTHTHFVFRDGAYVNAYSMARINGAA